MRFLVNRSISQMGGSASRLPLLFYLLATFYGGGLAVLVARPNVFIAISDDQSWAHASAYGSKMVQTPHFDRVAREGVLFTHAFAPSPGCSPSRAAFLTGRHTWQIEHAGTHASFFHPKYEAFPDRLASNGYAIGSTGKGWGPGNFAKFGRPHNPAGPRMPGPKKAGYAGGFEHFLKNVRKEGQPFCFWFGSSDPHRSFEKGSGLASGKTLEDAEVPAFLPDTPEIRNDLLDYAFEIERFDSDLGKMLDLLEASGDLENTVIMVMSDNGMAFPRAKANCFEYGIRMPLAVRWGKEIPAKRVVDDLVGFVDLTATLYDFCEVAPPTAFPIVGKSLADLLRSDQQGLVEDGRDAVYSARERHSSSRFRSLSYPQRALRTRDFLYVHNFKPERWPAGPAQKFRSARFSPDGKRLESALGPPHGGYHDIDACPTLDYLIEHRDDANIARYLEFAVGKRPAEELYAVGEDPACLINLAADPNHAATLEQHRERLLGYLKETGDPRVLGNGDVWETYPRVSSLRYFPEPDWAVEHPEKVPEQPWWLGRLPR